MTGAKRLGVSGVIDRYEVVTVGNRLHVYEKGLCVGEQDVDGLAKFVARPGGAIRLGVAWTADYTIVYVYDKDDDCFGYAFNITAPELSEWGYAPFRDDDPRTKRAGPRPGSRSRKTNEGVTA